MVAAGSTPRTARCSCCSRRPSGAPPSRRRRRRRPHRRTRIRRSRRSRGSWPARTGAWPGPAGTPDPGRRTWSDSTPYRWAAIWLLDVSYLRRWPHSGQWSIHASSGYTQITQFPRLRLLNCRRCSSTLDNPHRITAHNTVHTTTFRIALM
jgi:hypothetical protein